MCCDPLRFFCVPLRSLPFLLCVPPLKSLLTTRPASINQKLINSLGIRDPYSVHIIVFVKALRC